ncbi:tpr domain protein [Fusarium beomiforme]|uniref:Tpr domain protein n=1 Tax=Fusarium beomiforme TaxID=44412 RepID=A0A9P5E5E5_9HYPO|nr:tpr domain protein [Fusarium beomiforme]
MVAPIPPHAALNLPRKDPLSSDEQKKPLLRPSSSSDSAGFPSPDLPSYDTGQECTFRDVPSAALNREDLDATKLLGNNADIGVKDKSKEAQPSLSASNGDMAVVNNDTNSSTNAVAGLSDVIRSRQLDLDQTPQGDPDRPDRLDSLGLAYRERYSKTGEIADLNQTIKLHQESLDITPEGHAARPSRFDSLGLDYADRFLRAGEIGDISHAIQLHQMAIDCLPGDHPSRPGILDNLGLAYHDRSQRTGSSEDIEKSLNLHQEAVNTTPTGHIDQPRRIHNLGLVYHDKFQRVGAMADIDMAIQLYQEAADTTPKDCADWSGWIHNLGIAYHDKYQVTGTMPDLDRSIQLQQEALKTPPKSQLDQPRRLDSLGLAYGVRYERMGAMADLNESIRLHQEAVDVTFEDSPDRARRLESLGLGHADRYRRTGKVADLNKAIHLHQEAVDATPDGHPDRPGRLENLGLVYQAKYKESKNVEDLDMAIRLHQEGVKTTLPDNPNLPRRLNSLGLTYQARFQHTKAIVDLNRAIQLHTEAVDAIPEGHPARSEMLHNLGNGYQDRYQTTREVVDLGKSVQRYEEAMNHSSSPTLQRVRPGKALLTLLAEAGRWPLAYQAACTAVSLVPLLTPRSLENSDKQHLLLEVVGLASDAAAVALMAEATTHDAIQLLEIGRGIITGSMNEMRGDVSELQQEDPQLAEDYLELRGQLDAPTSTFELDELDSQTGPTRQFDHRYEAGQKLEQTIQAIRKLPGFERFLLAPSDAELKAAAASGPIAIINVSHYRCDALVVEENKLRAIPLPHLHRSDVEARAAALASPGLLDMRLLEWLWDTISKPVLDALGFSQTPDSTWPRIWWIPTGPLAKFPIHAAGYHARASCDTVLDRVISSYSSSARALIQSRQNDAKAKPRRRPEKAVLIGMQDLCYATQEINKLEGVCSSMQLQVLKPQPHRKEVLASLNDCDVFHFAGHGHTEATDPSQSALLLRDGPLTVASLFETNLHSHKPFLAYLSACGTGQTKHDGLIDESLHLMAACQLAGFRHVIGTLWQASDRSCLDIAIITYTWMQERDMSDESVSEGLHHAIRALRGQWVSENAVREAIHRGTRVHEDNCQVMMEQSRSAKCDPRDPRDIVSCDDTPLHWVPYVHFGV